MDFVILIGTFPTKGQTMHPSVVIVLLSFSQPSLPAARASHSSFAPHQVNFFRLHTQASEIRSPNHTLFALPENRTLSVVFSSSDWDLITLRDCCSSSTEVEVRNCSVWFALLPVIKGWEWGWQKILYVLCPEIPLVFPERVIDVFVSLLEINDFPRERKERERGTA